jgi:hypothetical protein
MQPNATGRSFPAIDRKGRPYVLTPVYRPAPSPAGEVRDLTRPVKPAASDFLGILAEDGRDVRRASRGRYLLSAPDGGELIALFSSDCHAV